MKLDPNDQISVLCYRSHLDILKKTAILADIGKTQVDFLSIFNFIFYKMSTFSASVHLEPANVLRNNSQNAPSRV